MPESANSRGSRRVRIDDIRTRILTHDTTCWPLLRIALPLPFSTENASHSTSIRSQGRRRAGTGDAVRDRLSAGGVTPMLDHLFSTEVHDARLCGAARNDARSR